MKKNRVLITGANSGIGLALTKKFLKEKYRVYAHYHSSNENLLKIKDSNLYTIQGDFKYADQVKKVFNSCISSAKRIDILINNAGTFYIRSGITEITEEDLDDILGVNLKAPFILSRMAIERMKEQKWGRIINISSIGVKYSGSTGSAAYTISKAALERMSLCFAKEGAAHNVLVNAVRVGVTNTKFHSLDPGKDISKRIKLIPLQRLAEPEEIVEVIFFLSSKKSSFVTGSIFTVAGGE